MSARSPALTRLARRRPARRAGSRRSRCRRRCPPARAARGSGARRRAGRPRSAWSAPTRRTARGRSPRRGCAGRRPARRSAARRPRSRRRAPARAGTARRPSASRWCPRPATKCVIVGRSARISGPVVVVVRLRRWPGCRTGRASPSRGAPRRSASRPARPRWTRRRPGEETISAPHIASSWRALDRGVLRHHADQPVALELGRHRQRDPGVARRRLEDRAARAQQPVLLGRLDHAQRRPVLDRPGRVAVLELGPQPHVGRRRQPRQPDQRGAADGVEQGVVSACSAVARQPPATAGRIVTVSPSVTGVSRPPRKRTSSSLR